MYHLVIALARPDQANQRGVLSASSARWLSALLVCSLALLTSCNGESQSEHRSDLPAGETAGEVAGETAGEVAGETAGEVAGETAGEVAGETAGEVSGETAGEVSGETAGEVAGETAIDPNEVRDLGADPSSFGPAGVGYLTEQITYSSQLADAREIRLAIWYPAIRESGTGPANYPLFTPEVAEAGATPDITGEAPLLIYSHGAKVWPEMGSFMAEFFASHGWVVVSVAHTGDSLDSLSGERPDPIYALRALDLSAALDHLEDLSAEHALARRVRTTRALVSGHSFGGYTSFISAGARFDMEHLRETRCVERGGTLCESLEGTLGEVMSAGLREPRFVAAIPQSAGNYQMIREGAAQVEIPTLMITATLDQACTEEGSNQPFWESLTAPDSPLRDSHRRLSFLEAGHATFTVACIHLPALEQDDGCGPDFTPVRDAQALMLAYSLTFARAHVLGDLDALSRINGVGASTAGSLPSLPSWAEWLQADP